MKNENGTGNIYKIKGKRRKPWAVRVTTGYTTDGKQIRKYIGTYETKKEAQEKLIEYLRSPCLFSKKTFKEIKELWWESYRRKTTNIRTIKTSGCNLKALASLDDMCIVDIKFFHLQNLFDNMTTSFSTKKACKSIMNMIFEFALKNEFISSNKVELIDVGKKEIVIKRKVFTKKEIEVLWDNLNSNEFIYTILILIYTGMRVSEFLNLKNQDIDLENKVIKINSSKTTAGIRIIPIFSKIFNLFKDNMFIGREYFLKGVRNERMSYSAYNSNFEKTLLKLGLEQHTIHDTRHTFATILNNSNANSTSITKLIGHKNFSVTEEIYTHKDVEELRKAIELLN